MDIDGTTGRDNIVGTIDPDLIDISQGQRDTVSAGDGDDTILVGAELRDNDEIDGGIGYDIVVLEGNYFGGLTLLPTTLVNCDQLTFEAGFTYDLTLDDATASGAFFSIDAAALGAGDVLVLDGSAETTAALQMEGGAGDDLLTGGGGGDIFRLWNGGDDTVSAGAGVDSFYFEEHLGAGDVIDGGTEFDNISLDGDYAAGIVIDGGMLSNIEVINLFARYEGHFTVTDDVLAALVSAQVRVISSGVSGNQISFDASAETDSSWSMQGGLSDDTFTGGALGDAFDLLGADAGGQGGIDVVVGNGGNDLIYFDGGFSRDDQVDGGDQFDTLTLDGDLSAGVNFRSTTMQNVEKLIFAAGHDYDLTIGDNNVRAGGLIVEADALGSSDQLIFDDSAESGDFVLVTSGAGDDVVRFGGGDNVVLGGSGDDSLSGGAGDDGLTGQRGRDTLYGGLGSDEMQGMNGNDVFLYTGVAESTGPGYDVLGKLKPLHDQIDLDVTVTGVDARVNAGSLSTATFNADLAGEIDAAALSADHAVVFKPNAGDLAGHFFLVVDANATDGYQADQDYVIEFAAGSHPNSIAVGFFI